MKLPQTWHQPFWQQLEQQFQQQRLAHAYLLSSPSGYGKQDFASAWVEWLIRQTASIQHTADPHPDCLWVESEPGKSIKVDQIRELNQFLLQAPFAGGYRIAAVNGAEAMNPAAANALLKTLEEPLTNRQLILVVNQIGKLLPTIRSRCQLLNFSRGAPQTSFNWHDEDGQLLLQDCQRLWDRKVDPICLANEWQTFTPQELLPLLQQLLNSCLKAKVSQPASGSFAKWANRLNLKALFAYWQQLLHTQKQVQAGINMNPALLFERLTSQLQTIIQPVGK